ASKLEKKVVAASMEFGVEAIVRVEGSVAKDTWLSGEPDIDVFMRVPATVPRMSLGEVCLKVAKKATAGSRQVERFADHPYIEAFVDDIRVNIVPCYEAKPGKWLSATDRTPFHTDYMRRHLSDQLRKEVRLLKKFMKGIGVYGAEIKIGGLSGYLCELLTLYCGSFVDTLKFFSDYRQGIVVDIEGYYRDRKSELKLLFTEPLIVVDPIDKGRNVASAVQSQKLYTLVAAAQTFLRDPRLNFFYPNETKRLAVDELKKRLSGHGSAMVFVTFGKVDAVPDVLWGQLYKSQRSLRKLVQLSDFAVLRDTAWSDEKRLNMFVFELEDSRISGVKKHLGPPLDKQHECEKFLSKYRNNADVMSGPYVEDGRWIVQLRRKHVDVRSLLHHRLKGGGKEAGVADRLSKVMSSGFRTLVDSEIIETYRKNKEFAVFLTDFLSGRPKWLEPVKSKSD
ncbi:MAG TPA: CCA tRNA nucleotidyltransferase, partial [Candidatus Eisenbacteria bacterium]|nr:CCA tRNA nucleotidyltransferase [Candidatus Eisenbacteria bacterium]